MVPIEDVPKNEIGTLSVCMQYTLVDNAFNPVGRIAGEDTSFTVKTRKAPGMSPGEGGMSPLSVL